MKVLRSYIGSTVAKLKAAASSFCLDICVSQKSGGDNEVAANENAATVSQRNVGEKDFILGHVEAVINEAKELAIAASEVVIIIEHDTIDDDHHVYQRGFLLGISSFWRHEIDCNRRTLEQLAESFFLAVEPNVDSEGHVTFQAIRKFSPGLVARATAFELALVPQGSPVQAVFHEIEWTKIYNGDHPASMSSTR